MPDTAKVLSVINTEVKLSLVGLTTLICSVAAVTWGAHGWIQGQFDAQEVRTLQRTKEFHVQIEAIRKDIAVNTINLAKMNVLLVRIERQLGQGSVAGTSYEDCEVPLTCS